MNYSALLIVLLLTLIAFPVHAATMSFLLNWRDNSMNEAGFILEQRVGDNAAPWVAVEELPADATTRVIELSGTPQFLNLRRCYRVKAFNALGISTPTNTQCVRMSF